MGAIAALFFLNANHAPTPRTPSVQAEETQPYPAEVITDSDADQAAPSNP